MDMQQLYTNEQYKILKVSLGQGEAMPLHKATADAFIVVQQGRGRIIFTDREVELTQNSTCLIPAEMPHQLKVTDDFKACVVMAKEGEIKFI